LFAILKEVYKLLLFAIKLKLKGIEWDNGDRNNVPTADINGISFSFLIFSLRLYFLSVPSFVFLPLSLLRQAYINRNKVSAKAVLKMASLFLLV
jgi:hypothetical protein